MCDLSDLTGDELKAIIVSEGRTDIYRGFLRVGFGTNPSDVVADELKTLLYRLGNDPSCSTDFHALYEDLSTAFNEVKRTFPAVETYGYKKFGTLFRPSSLFGSGNSDKGVYHERLAPSEEALQEFDTTVQELERGQKSTHTQEPVWESDQEADVYIPPFQHSTDTGQQPVGREISREVKGDLASGLQRLTNKRSASDFADEPSMCRDDRKQRPCKRDDPEFNRGRRSSVDILISQFDQGMIVTNTRDSIRSTATDYLRNFSDSDDSDVSSTASDCSVDIFKTVCRPVLVQPEKPVYGKRKNSIMSLGDVANRFNNATFDTRSVSGEVIFD